MSWRMLWKKTFNGFLAEAEAGQFFWMLTMPEFVS